MNWANETLTFIKALDKVNKTALPASWEIRMVEKATAPMKRTLKKSTLTPIHRTLARTKENAWLCLSWCLEETKNEFSLSFFKHFRSVVFSSLLVATFLRFIYLFIYIFIFLGVPRNSCLFSVGSWENDGKPYLLTTAYGWLGPAPCSCSWRVINSFVT